MVATQRKAKKTKNVEQISKGVVGPRLLQPTFALDQHGCDPIRKSE
jgi:hypothetical protein